MAAMMAMQQGGLASAILGQKGPTKSTLGWFENQGNGIVEKSQFKGRLDHRWTENILIELNSQQ